MLWKIGLVLGLGVLAWYLWSQRRPLTPGAFHRRAPFERLMALRRPTLLGALALIILLCLGTVWGIKAMMGTKKAKPVVIMPPSRTRGGVGGDILAGFPKDYRTQPPEEPQPTPTPQPMGQVVAQPSPQAQAPSPGPSGRGQEHQGPPAKPEPTPRPAAQAQPQPQRQPAASQTTAPAQTPPARQQAQGQRVVAQAQEPTDWRWFSGKNKIQTVVLKSPFANDPEEIAAQKQEGAGGALPQQGTPPQQGGPGQQATPSKLFPKAIWEEPLDKYKVLYSHQIVTGVLYQRISNKSPGVFRIEVDQDVMDQWGHGHVLIQRDTKLMGIMGKESSGNEVLMASIYQANFPDGRSLAWEGQDVGQAGSAAGEAGIPANVDHHYGKLFLGVGISALLAMGPRIAAGSPSPNQFGPNLPQEFANQASNGATQALAPVIRQKFFVPDTYSQEFAFPVTVQFVRNLSFQTPPVEVSR